MEKYTLLSCFLVCFFLKVKLFLIILFQKQLNVNRICEIVMWDTLVYYYNYIDDYLVWPSIFDYDRLY